LNPKKQEEPAIKTRPAGKLPPGSAFQKIGREPDGTQMAEILGLQPATPTTSTTPTTPTTTTTSTTPTTSIAPTRDFTRVANSIMREAVPAGIFTGKSKQVYDYLYSQTRGYVAPRRSVRLPMSRLMSGSGIGSDRTLRNNLRRLVDAGLLAVTEIGGTQGGNEFTVFLPEEVTPTTPTTTTTPTPSSFDHGYPPQNVGVVQVVESAGGTGGLSADNQEISGEPKTSFKTNTERTDDDDAALAGLYAALKQASIELTGKDLSLAESERWRELAEVLIAEVKIAAARTTVSSLPAFLAEHLRRRLWKIDKRRALAEGTETPDQGLSASPSADYSKCPDCAGSNWYYPEGQEKGIKRCRHEKLRVESGEGK
jgi:hypothetical protein